ncbi:MAG: DegT/DnrJ/EryC1/StrS family aminotransferase [Elusimicrobia bacterium]|nr:DegT/DnrJ/EryC1/StrS family aminotransferase [Elusimicrobiota bacterium]
MDRSIQISLPSTGEEEWQACREPLMTGWLTQGAKVAAFEKAFAKRHGVAHALATTSCTTGLHLILAAMGIGPGDEVIVPAFTWVATANVVLYCGATVVFVDVDRATNNIDPVDLARKLTSKTRAVIAVHLFGLCADMDAIRAIVPAGIKIIEDAACAAGASYKRTFAGALGDAAAFSFHPRKSITTGEGGMVTTNDGRLAEVVNMLRNHGASVSEEQRHKGPRPYLLPQFNLLGYNYRMTDLQGAIGLAQLAKLDRFIEERHQYAEYYRETLANLGWLRMPVFPENGTHAWQAFVTYVDPTKSPMTRDKIMERLQAAGIATRPGTHAVHMLGYYRDRLGLKPEHFPAARDCDANTMALPLHNRMKKRDYEYIVEILHNL